MSMRFGTSMTFRTRPRCFLTRKLDWMTFAIGAPHVCVGPIALSLRVRPTPRNRTAFFYKTLTNSTKRPGHADLPGATPARRRGPLDENGGWKGKRHAAGER